MSDPVYQFFDYQMRIVFLTKVFSRLNMHDLRIVQSLQVTSGQVLANNRVGLAQKDSFEISFFSNNIG